MAFEDYAPLANKMRNADGSVTDFTGTQTFEAASAAGVELFNSMMPIKNQMINEDGSYSPLPSGGGGGGGTDTNAVHYTAETKTLAQQAQARQNIGAVDAGYTGFATAAQGAKADTALQPSAIGDTVQEKLTFDDTPTAGSDNPVTSDGISDAIQLAAHGYKIGQAADYGNIRGDIPSTGTAAFVEGNTLFNRVDNKYYTYTSGAWVEDTTQPTVDTADVYDVNIGLEMLNLYEGLGFRGHIIRYYDTTAANWDSNVDPQLLKIADGSITEPKLSTDLLAKINALYDVTGTYSKLEPHLFHANTEIKWRDDSYTQKLTTTFNLNPSSNTTATVAFDENFVVVNFIANCHASFESGAAVDLDNNFDNVLAFKVRRNIYNSQFLIYAASWANNGIGTYTATIYVTYTKPSTGA
jgi:hypothetical protein